MKKTSFFKLIFSVFSAVLLMSSCLGDGDSSFTIEKDFAYITYDTYNRKYAVTSNGYIMHDAINNLTANQCYYIGYKVTSTTSDGYYLAEYVNVLDNGKYIDQTDLSISTPPVNPTDSITPTSLSIGSWSPGSIIGDNWLINYNMTKRDDDKVTMTFYYDENNQKENGEDLEDNRIIIDIRFRITETGTDQSVTTGYSAVGNMARLRNYYPIDFGNAEYVNVPVKFRYQRYTSANQPADVVTLGSWTESSTGYYYIQFTK